MITDAEEFAEHQNAVIRDLKIALVDERRLNRKLVEALAELVEALTPLAEIPYEDFDWRHNDDNYPAMSWNGIAITLGDINRARAVLEKVRQK